MPINNWCDITKDAITKINKIGGWPDQSGKAYGMVVNRLAPGLNYSFGPLKNGYGTWGQLIYAIQGNLQGQDLGNPTGLNRKMPRNQHMPGKATKWIQGHLINGECGGDGALAANLTPLTNTLNRKHSGYETVIRRLANRGTSLSQQMFNPNKLPNTWFIYRTHACPPNRVRLPNHPKVPAAIFISLGIVVQGKMQTLADVQNEFQSSSQSWFAPVYYTSTLKSDRQRILSMINGVQLPQ